jgi:hypothetical protein
MEEPDELEANGNGLGRGSVELFHVVEEVSEEGVSALEDANDSQGLVLKVAHDVLRHFLDSSMA